MGMSLSFDVDTISLMLLKIHRCYKVRFSMKWSKDEVLLYIIVHFSGNQVKWPLLWKVCLEVKEAVLCFFNGVLWLPISKVDIAISCSSWAMKHCSHYKKERTMANHVIGEANNKIAACLYAATAYCMLCTQDHERKKKIRSIGIITCLSLGLYDNAPKIIL